ncbi:MAG: hypothetical protein C4521_03040 [Actinobacteria bacterium]|nr:MAG: hypothetical protein C4521_03040 [Actinomycetota bacterium]
MEDKNVRIDEAVRKAADDNRISCTVARGIAGELEVPVCDVGEAADRLGVKIYGCELGCF